MPATGATRAPSAGSDGSRSWRASLFAIVVRPLAVVGRPARRAGTLEARDTTHEVLGPTAVSVSWELTTEPGTRSACAIQALNGAFAIVGWRILELPAGDVPTRSFTTELLTSEPAVTGSVYRCWLT